MLAFASLLAYERQADDALVVGAGVDAKWIAAPGGISVRSLPTWYGSLDLTMKREANGALLDLHIHDTDFVQFCFGRPKAVYSTGFRFLSGETDHIVTQYHFDSGACVSADMAHAVHPNYQDRHEPDHRPLPNAGPVLKANANQRYATDAVSATHFTRACERADVPWQVFVSRNNMPCGSTIGPITSARLGIRSVDVGCPMWAMHSLRESAGVLSDGSFGIMVLACLRQLNKGTGPSGQEPCPLGRS